jgi:rhodanese-related sulfurtransferase
MHRLRTTLGLAALSLLVLSAPALAAEHEPFTLMTAAELKQVLGAPDVKVFDANGPAVYAKAHLPGARLIDYQDFTAGELPQDRATRVIFYCKNTH